MTFPDPYRFNDDNLRIALKECALAAQRQDELFRDIDGKAKSVLSLSLPGFIAIIVHLTRDGTESCLWIPSLAALTLSIAFASYGVWPRRYKGAAMLTDDPNKWLRLVQGDHNSRRTFQWHQVKELSRVAKTNEGHNSVKARSVKVAYCALLVAIGLAGAAVIAP